jgi:hypothetical protein
MYHSPYDFKVLEELFLVNRVFIFCQILNFSNSSFPARNTPNQNIFEPINRMGIAIAVVFDPNFKKGIRKINAQKT